jgi:hypothetical protein
MRDFQVAIVVEGKQFLPIVESVLADPVRDVKVDWIASDYSAFGHARSALRMRHRPVLLVVNSEFNDPAEGEYRRSILYRGLYDVADREFWEVAMADPNLEAWRVANGREAAELIAKTPDLQAAVAFLERVKNGAVVAG